MRNTLIFAIAIIALLFSSCHGERKRVIESELPLEKFVSDFRKQYPNYFQNDILTSKGDSAFLAQIEANVDTLHLFEGIPVRLKAITKDSKGGYVAQFRCVGFQTRGFEYKDSITEVMFDMWGNVNEEMVNKLEEEKDYSFYGKCIGFLKTYEMAQVISNSRPTVWTPEIKLRQDDIYKEKVEVMLGMSYWQIDSIIDFKGRPSETIIEKY